MLEFGALELALTLGFRGPQQAGRAGHRQPQYMIRNQIWETGMMNLDQWIPRFWIIDAKLKDELKRRPFDDFSRPKKKAFLFLLLFLVHACLALEKFAVACNVSMPAFVSLGLRPSGGRLINVRMLADGCWLLAGWLAGLLTRILWSPINPSGRQILQVRLRRLTVLVIID